VKSGETPGYPRFKARDRYTSILFPSHGDGIRLTGDRLRVQHVGTVRVKLHRPTEGKIKTLALKEDAGKWYLVVSCDLGDVPVPTHCGPAVGIDMGLESFLTTSEGERVENPRYLKTALPALRRANRAVSRKTKGGANRRKAVARLRRAHRRVGNLRREHQFQVAHRLTSRYGLIAVEGLNVDTMLKNHRLARSIADAGWSGFVGILAHKAEKAGARVVEVDPRGTSQACFGCGVVVPKTLSVRWHECPDCGLSLHRDHNAALNILRRGLARMEPAGLNTHGECVPRSRLL
jgi:putative transposase